MPPSNEESQSPIYTETCKVALYGASGSRKTLQIGSLIKEYGAENVGIISCEYGLSTIKSLVKTDHVYVAQRLAALDDKDTATMRHAWEWAKKQQYKWLCIDGGSRVLEWIQQDIFGGAQRALEMVMNGIGKRELPSPVRRYGAYVTKDDDLNTQQMWIRVGFESTRLFDSFISLGSNLYFTFWEEQTSLDQYKKGPPWKPDTPGKGSFGAIKGAFDFIGRLVNEGEQSSAIFANSGVQYGKRRDDRDAGIIVPDVIKEFNLAEFAKLVRAER